MERVKLGTADLNDPTPEWVPVEIASFMDWVRGYIEREKIQNFTFTRAQLRAVQDEATARGLEFTEDGSVGMPQSVH